MQPNGHVISWEEFRNTFRAHHIPEGLMERKLNEFLALTQGTAPYCNTHRLSITCASTRVITLTVTPRSKIVFVGA
jgi:hypothetical protein